MFKPETKSNENEGNELDQENEPGSFYMPTRSVTINSTQNIDSNGSRNSCVLLTNFIRRSG